MDRALSATTLIVPMRHPQKIWGTWCKQGRPDRELFFDSFDLMESVYQRRYIYFLPVDHDGRDWYLDEICTVTGKKLTTDWTPKDHQRTKPENVVSTHMTETDLSYCFGLSFVQLLYSE